MSLSLASIATLVASSAVPTGATVPTLPEPIRLPVAYGRQDPAPPVQNPNAFNPQIAIVGDFVGNLDRDDDEPRKWDFREIEFAFAADADPMLRVEIYIAVANEDGEVETEVEEAFGRYASLGRGLSAKFGKFAAAVGRVSRNHADQLDYLDYPLVIQDMLGEEGFRRPGASVSYLFPGERFHELTFEALDAGDEGPVFNNSTLDAPALVGRYRTFVDFNDDLSAQFGLSYLSGPTLGSDSRGDLYGVDMVAKWQPGTRGRSAMFESEAYWAKPSGMSRRMGWFARGSYEIAPRLFVTGGYDYSEVPGSAETRRGYLVGGTYRLTEFHHWRLEFQRIESNLAADRNVLNLQFQFVIGAHPAHKY